MLRDYICFQFLVNTFSQKFASTFTWDNHLCIGEEMGCVYAKKKCTDTGTPDNHKVHSKVTATFNSFH